MQVEDRLPTARPDVDEHPVVLQPDLRAPSRRRTRACASPPRRRTRRRRGTCRRGAPGCTSTCTGACGLMSLIATNPSPRCTWSPSRTSVQKRQSSRCGGKDSLLGDRGGPNADELADRRVDEPRRVVVAVAAAGPVDEHDVVLPSFALPAPLRRARARARAARRRAPSSPAAAPGRRPAVTVPGRGEYGKTCTFVMPGRSTVCERRARTRARPRPGSRRSRRSSG